MTDSRLLQNPSYFVRIQRVRFITTTVIALLVLLFGIAQSDDLTSDESIQSMRLAGGVNGLVYQSLSEICEELAHGRKVQITAVPTHGSWENVTFLSENHVQFALAQLDVVSKYSDLYLNHNLTAIRPLFTEYLHILVREPFELFDISELSGKRIYMGPARSGSAVTAKILLDLNGVPPHEYTRVNITDINNIHHLLMEDSLDVVMYVCPIGSKFVIDLLTSVNCRLFSLNHDTVRRITMQSSNKSSSEIGIGTIPSNKYPNQPKSIIAVATPVILICLPDIPPPIISEVDSIVGLAIDTLIKTEEYGNLELSPVLSNLPLKIVPLDPSIWKKKGQFSFWINIGSLIAIIGVLYFILRKYSRRFVLLIRRQRSIHLLATLATIFLLSAVGIYSLEHSINQYFGSLYETIWSMLMYLTSGLENRAPITPIGKILAAAMLVTGPILVAILMGFFASSIIINTLERKMTGNLKNHYVILNWNNRTMDVVEQLHSPDLKTSELSVIVILSDDPKLNFKELQKKFKSETSDQYFEDVYFHPGDPSNENSLLNANVQDAKSILIMADTNDSKTADEKSIRSLLALQKIAEDKEKNNMHVVIELLHIENYTVVDNISRHFPGIIDSISGARIRTLLLAQATLIPGLTGFYRDLLCFSKDSNELYLVEIPSSAIGKTFPEYAAEVIRCNSKQPIIPVGIFRNNNGKSILINNPKPSNGDGSDNPYYRFHKGDNLLVLSYETPDPKELPAFS